MSRSIREYREMLEPEDIKDILMKFDVSPVRETQNYILYPTVDHNLSGGSPKLYYYKKDRLFKSYTGDQRLFDIFQLIMDMHYLRGEEISLRQAVKFCGIDSNEPIEENQYYNIREQLDYLYEIQNQPADEPISLKTYPSSIMSRYIYNIQMLQPWISEKITPDSLVRFGIKYDTIEDAIVIPYFSFDGELVGIRGRFLREDAYAKYMPMKCNGITMSHPTGKVLFGLSQNKKAIKKHKKVILFEGEKSVLKIDSIYGSDRNFSVAVSGRNFSLDHMQMLLDLDINEIIVAFDRDYKSDKDIEKEMLDMNRIFGSIKNIVNVSVIIDSDFILHHKNSPIDQGEEIFEALMSKRVFL